MWKGLALCHKKDYEAALNAFALLDTPESWFNQGNALAYLKKYPEALKLRSAQKAPSSAGSGRQSRFVRLLIPPPPKKLKEEEAMPYLKPDQIKFDEKSKKGKQQNEFR